MNASRSQKTYHRIAKVIAGAAAVVMTTATSHALLLTFDLRAVHEGVLATDQGVNGTSPTIDVSNPHAPVGSGGRLILQLFAVFNGVDGNDAFQFTQGSVVSVGATGDFLLPNAGTLRSTVDGALSNNVPNFNASTSRSGNPTEASLSYGGTADGVLDIGDLATNNTLTSSPVQWFTADSGPSSFPVPSGNEVLIGEFALTIGPAVHSGQVGFQYFMRPRNTGSITIQRIQKFTNDGAVYSLNFQGVGTKDGAAFTDANAFAAAGIMVTVPEPSAFGMVLLGALGLVGFRRIGFRNT